MHNWQKTKRDDLGPKLKLRKIGKKTQFCLVWLAKKYIGLKILSNAKAEILSKNAKKRKAKNIKLRCGAKNWRKMSKKRATFFGKDEEQTYRKK